MAYLHLGAFRTAFSPVSDERKKNPKQSALNELTMKIQNNILIKYIVSTAEALD